MITRKPIAFLLAFLLIAGAAGCEFQAAADAKFGDQHFKTVIALVELQKLRGGPILSN